jgi:hypothetical protein
MIGRQGEAACQPPHLYDRPDTATHEIYRDQAVVSARSVAVNKFFQMRLDTGTGASL